MKLSLSALLLGLLLLGLTPTNAWGQTGATTPYTLESGSKLERGCIDGPCACPVISSKMSGGFNLRSLPPDPLYSHYAVENLDFLANEPGHALRIVGSGTYRVGGEVALRERMTLDLSVEGGPVQHYDSGDVAGGGDFPRITIAVRLHNSSVCTDTILTIDAAPGGVVGIEPHDGLASRVAPNPFTHQAEIRFGLPRESEVEVSIHDLAGRRVRHLLNERLGPGVWSRAWDGRTDDGVAAAAGMYRVRIQASDESAELAVVKLR